MIIQGKAYLPIFLGQCDDQSSTILLWRWQRRRRERRASASPSSCDILLLWSLVVSRRIRARCSSQPIPSRHPGPHSACPGKISSSYSIGVQIEVGRDALEVQAVWGRLPAPEPPARSGAEWPTEVEAEELLAVAAVGQAGVALRDGPGCHANGVLPEVGHEEQEEGQGGEDDVRADEEGGGGHGGSCVLPRVAGG